MFDIVAVESCIQPAEFSLSEEDTAGEFHIATWLMENPELTAVDVLGAVGAETGSQITSEFVTNSSLIYYHGEAYLNLFAIETSGAGASDYKATGYRYFKFPQPYTVARNILVSAKAEEDNSSINAWRADFTVWGRRRKAVSNNEWENIIYRQRF